MELLVLCIEAGLDIAPALGRVVEHLEASPLSKEWNRCLVEVRMGKNRSKAFKALSERIPTYPIQFLCRAFIQADKIGSSLGPTIATQATILREQIHQEELRKVQIAPIKILAPLAICIFPNLFILLLAPLAAQIANLGVMG